MKNKSVKKVVIILIVMVLSSMFNLVFGAELLIIDDMLYQYVDTDNSGTINIEDKIILDGETFNVMAEENEIIYAMADAPLNSSGEKQDSNDYLKTSNQIHAKDTLEKYR